MNPRASLPLLLAALLSAAGCGADVPTPTGDATGQIRGHVLVGAAPVSGAVVFAYAIDAAGTRTEVAASEPTDDAGAFTLDIPATVVGALELEARGAAASYTEPASGSRASFTAQTRLRAPLVRWKTSDRLTLDFHFARGDARDAVVINLWTELATAYAGALVRTGGEPTLERARDQALRALRDHLEHDFWTVQPAPLTGDPIGAFDDPALAGALGAGFSHLARRIAVASSLSPGSISSLTLLEALVRDLGDAGAVLDGAAVLGGPALSVGACTGAAFCQLSPHFFRADFAESLGLFLASPRNTSGVRYGDVEALLSRMAFRAGPLWAEGGVAPDRTPPQVSIDGLQDGGVLSGDRVTFTVTVTDAFALAPTEPIILARADGSQSWTEGGGGPITAVRDESSKTRHTLSVTVDSTAFVDGPLTLQVTARDEAGNSRELAWTVFSENSPAGSITGTVVLGGRVRGARVSVYDATGGPGDDLGAPLGQGTTDDAGAFSFMLADAPAARVLSIVVTSPPGSAASFVDIATGDAIALSQTDRFEVFFSGYQEGDTISVMVTPFSIMGAAFARALWKSPAWYDRNPDLWPAAIADATSAWQAHVDDLGPPIDFLAVRPADLANETEAGTLSAQVRYGLLIAGLSSLAASHARASETTSASVNTLSLTHLLASDIGAFAAAGEPLFDGRSAAGALSSGDVVLSSYATRVDLAQHIALFIEENPFDRTTLVEADVFPLLDVISLDASTRLYPPSDPPIAYDTTPPGPVAFVSPSPADGAVLRGLVDLRVTARDNRKLTELSWTAPASIADSALDITAGQAGPWILSGSLDLDALPEGPVTVAAVASDEALNETPATRTFIIDRTPPLITITSASDGATSLSPGDWTGASSLTAVTGAMSDTNGLSASYRWRGGPWLPLSLSGDSFSITDLPLAGGANTLELRATDPAGNAASTSVTYHRDATPPVVAAAAAAHVASMEEEATYSIVISSAPLSVDYQTAGAISKVVQDGITYTKWADRYTAAGPNLPQWRWTVSDNRTADANVLAEYRILRGTIALTDWTALLAASGTGFNRALTVHSGLHPDIGQADGTFSIEVRATDGFGNISAPARVTWTQTIKQPALLVSPAPSSATGDCAADKLARYTLGNTSGCAGGGPANNFATVLNGDQPSFRVAAWVIENPNTIAARVRADGMRLGGSYERGVVVSTPDAGVSWQPATDCGPPDSPWYPVLRDGTCYTLPAPGRDESVEGIFIFNKQTGADWRESRGDGNGPIVSPCVGCVAGEYEIPPGGSLMVWVKTGPLSWLDADGTGYRDAGPWIDSDPVSGIPLDAYRACDRVTGTPPNRACASFTIRQAVRHLTRVELRWNAYASFESRAGEAATWSLAPGGTSDSAPGGARPVATYETGYGAF